MLHGSEGGSLPYASLEAQFLAAHGYAPIQWLKTSTYVNGGKVAVLGWSRGAELGILLGSIGDAIRFVDAIAVHAPSDTVVSGFSWAALDKRCWICSSFDLTCFKLSDNPSQWDWQNMKWNPSCGKQPKLPNDTQSWVLDGTPIKIGKVIEIERFKKPVFVTVGDQDQIWDYKKSIRIKERLETFGQPIELHIFPAEHHNFSDANENKRHQLLVDFLERVL